MEYIKRYHGDLPLGCSEQRDTFAMFNTENLYINITIFLEKICHMETTGVFRV